MKILLAWGLGVLLLAGAAGGGDKKDADKLDGTWKAEVDGKKIDLQFTKDNFTITFDVGPKTFSLKGTYKLDPSKKPKQMDLKITEGDQFVGESALAIYEQDGDTLKWCASKPGQDKRPTAFPAKQGHDDTDRSLFLILKRAK